MSSILEIYEDQSADGSWLRERCHRYMRLAAADMDGVEPANDQKAESASELSLQPGIDVSHLGCDSLPKL